jgi:hypothetical protein
MPAALERALKRRAAKLGLGKERKDAYVYGTLRKTGWKPSHQMNTPNDRLIRLGAIKKNLDSIVQLQYEDPYVEKKDKFPLAVGGAGAVAGAGGVLAHQAIKRSGGYAANLGAAKAASRFGPDLLAKATGQAFSPGRAAGSALWKMKNLAKPLLGRFGLESKEKEISMDETLLEPFQGSAFKSKIEQLQFPAGISPLMAMKMPFPKLMALLQKKQILRQVFSKKEKLIELNAKLDEIQFREDRSGKTWTGAAVAAGGAAAGYGAYRGGRAIAATNPIKRARVGQSAFLKTVSRAEPLRRPLDPFKLVRRASVSGYKAARYAKFSTQLDDLVEFQLPDNLKDKLKEKVGFKKKKKGRVSHGGGT